MIEIGALTRAQLVAEVWRLYAQLRALPTIEQPEVNGGVSGRSAHGGPAYQALEAEIRRYADAYNATTETEPAMTRRRCG